MRCDAGERTGKANTRALLRDNYAKMFTLFYSILLSRRKCRGKPFSVEDHPPNQPYNRSFPLIHRSIQDEVSAR